MNKATTFLLTNWLPEPLSWRLNFKTFCSVLAPQQKWSGFTSIIGNNYSPRVISNWTVYLYGASLIIQGNVFDKSHKQKPIENEWHVDMCLANDTQNVLVDWCNV